MGRSTSARVVVGAVVASTVVAGWGAGAADAALSHTSQVDVSSQEVPADAGSSEPDMSGNGRYVVFTSAAGNLVAGDDNGLDDVFLRDRTTGTTRLVSTAGAPADGSSGGATVSNDGRWVAFASTATNLDGGGPDSDVFLRDMVGGAVTRVGTGESSALSANGRYVAFGVPAEVRRYDRTTGRTRAVSEGVGPQISGNGRYVVTFDFDAQDQPSYLYTDLAGRTTRDLLATAKASPDWNWDDDPTGPVMSTDGRYVAFSTDASGLNPADTTESEEVYLVDTGAGDAYRRVTGEYADMVESTRPPLAISGNGRVLAFHLQDTTAPQIGELVTLDRVTGLVSKVTNVGDGFEQVGLDHQGSRVVHQTPTHRLRTGRVATCTIDGTNGADVLTGTNGRDVICGRAGNDVVRGRGGDDILAGGRGTDRVSYSTSTAGVTVRLHAWRARGAGQDEVHGFEGVDGSPYADRIVGDHRHNLLRGLGGDDVVVGHGGDDTMLGGTGTDRCDGGDGTDDAVSCETETEVP